MKTIGYRKKCFSYALEENKGDKSELTKNMEAFLPHSFGDHDKCDEKRCGYSRDPSNFRYNSLPFRKPLEDADLKKSLKEVFSKQIYTEISRC